MPHRRRGSGSRPPRSRTLCVSDPARLGRGPCLRRTPGRPVLAGRGRTVAGACPWAHSRETGGVGRAGGRRRPTPCGGSGADDAAHVAPAARGLEHIEGAGRAGAGVGHGLLAEVLHDYAAPVAYSGGVGVSFSEALVGFGLLLIVIWIVSIFLFWDDNVDDGGDSGPV